MSLDVASLVFTCIVWNSSVPYILQLEYPFTWTQYISCLWWWMFPLFLYLGCCEEWFSGYEVIRLLQDLSSVFGVNACDRHCWSTRYFYFLLKNSMLFMVVVTMLPSYQHCTWALISSYHCHHLFYFWWVILVKMNWWYLTAILVSISLTIKSIIHTFMSVGHFECLL